MSVVIQFEHVQKALQQVPPGCEACGKKGPEVGRKSYVKQALKKQETSLVPV